MYAFEHVENGFMHFCIQRKCTDNLFSRKSPHKTIIYLISILLIRYIVPPMLIKRRNMKLTSKEKSRSYRFVLIYTISSNYEKEAMLIVIYCLFISN